MTPISGNPRPSIRSAALSARGVARGGPGKGLPFEQAGSERLSLAERIERALLEAERLHGD